MKWTKFGKIFCASGESSFMQKAGHAPIALHLENDTYRVFFGAYDEQNRGRVFSLDLNLNEPNTYQNIVTTPLVDIGDFGFYDDNGILPSAAIRFNNSIYLYTIGFSVKNRITFDAAIGLATSTDNGATFQKNVGPVLDRSLADPCFATSPCILKDEKTWHMWYVSGEYWKQDGEDLKHFYNIKHRSSEDGIYWNHEATTCIDFANEYEYAIARPSVIRTKEGLYRMWYCFRAQPIVDTYRIGYAESADGKEWERKDHLVGIDVSESGWDSEMICYPCVFEHKEKLYMLYNGNGYGKSGFGLAVLEEE